MSLEATIEDAVEQAFAAVGDLVKEGTWTTRTLGAYNAALGARAEVVATRPVRVIQESVKIADVKALELSEHAVKLYIPGRDFTAAPAIEPKRLDRVTFQGKTYTVKASVFEVSKALWAIHADL